MIIGNIIQRGMKIDKYPYLAVCKTNIEINWDEITINDIYVISLVAFDSKDRNKSVCVQKLLGGAAQTEVIYEDCYVRTPDRFIVSLSNQNIYYEQNTV